MRTPDYFLKYSCLVLVMLLAACASTPTPRIAPPDNAIPIAGHGNEIVMYAMGLMDNDYRFGGDNPESGLDCSGMVSYIYQQALGIKLPHNASQIALAGDEISLSELAPGDLVFFNTNGKSYSHVGIYIGDDRFVHAPGKDGKIKVSSLKTGYFKKRLEAARSFFKSESPQASR